MQDDTIRFGIIGAAGRGDGFTRVLQLHPEAVVVALCDIQEDKVRQISEEIGVEHVFTDAEDMLDSGKIDAVVVGTPMHFHVPQSIMALERDLHVISEVPAGISIEECRDLVRASRQSKARYMMAENYTYMKPNILVRELVQRGLLGDIYYAEGAYIHELKAQNEKTPWRRRWQTGVNGCTYGTHSLGPVLQWFEGQRVVSVCAMGTGHHYKDPRGDRYETEDSVTMMCRLSSGALLQIRVDMLSDRPHNMAHYVLQGTDGSYESSDAYKGIPKIWLRSRSEELRWEPLENLEEEFLPEYWRKPPEAALKAGHGGGDYWEVHDFIMAIKQDKEPPIGIDCAMDMTLPGLTSQQSIAQGSTWVAVPDSRNWM